MKVIALLEVDLHQLEDNNLEFASEMGWVEQSGIYLQDYEAVNEDSRILVRDNSIELL